MACPPSRDSIENEAACEDTVIYIPPDLPPMERPKDTVINIPPLPPAEWPECCIYRVPKKLRKVNPKAYTPKFVSIGPFHHCRKELKDMKMQKLRYLKDFLDQTEKSQQDLLKIIEGDEEKIRHCYSEGFTHISSIDFVKMILLDAIFIIELFLKTNEKEEKDYILRKPFLGHGILHDLILLENQLPFFVLENLYVSAGINDNHPPFLDLFCNYFTHYKWANYSFKSKEVKQNAKQKVQQQVLQDAWHRQEARHFTDLVRLLYRPSDVKHWWTRAEGRPDTRFCATKLDDLGFNFKGDEDYSKPLLDVTVTPYFARFPIFQSLLGSLEVPQLVIDHETEVFFRNLMALEQCHYPYEAYICNYVWLLDRLIETEKDVDLLVNKKVIANNLGSNAEVATLINKLSNHIVTTTSSDVWDLIAQKLNEHYEYPLNRKMATLKREYFPNIFRGTATILGLIVLVFTLWSFLKPFVV